MSLREVLLPLQLSSNEVGLDLLKSSTLKVHPVYLGADPSSKPVSPPSIPASIQLREKLHYVSFRPSLPGFYRLHVLLDGKDFCKPPLLHILSDGTLLTSTLPPNSPSVGSGLIDPRPAGLRIGGDDAMDTLEPSTPASGISQSGRVQQKLSGLVSAIRDVTRRTDRSGVTVRTNKTTPKIPSNKPFAMPDFLKRFRGRLKPDLAHVMEQMSSAPSPHPGQLRRSRSFETLTNASIRTGYGSIRIHEFQEPQREQSQSVCCICGSLLPAGSGVDLYKSQFCEEDFSRFYLQRNVREHFLVPVLQETYLPGLKGQGALAQVNLKGLEIRHVKMGQDFFRLLDSDGDGWIGRHQLSSLLLRILIKILVDESQSKNILSSPPYKAMASGMGLEKRGRVHEIEFLACLAFCVREFMDIRTILKHQTKPRLLDEASNFYSADELEMDLPDHLSYRSSYHTPLSDEESLYLDPGSEMNPIRPRTRLQKEIKNRVSKDSTHPDEGWMMY